MDTAVGVLSRKPSMVKLHHPASASGSAGMGVSKASGSWPSSSSSTSWVSSTDTGFSPMAFRQTMRLLNSSHSALNTM